MERAIAFESDATNLVPGDTNAVEDVFVRDRQVRTTNRVSVSSAGAEANNFSGLINRSSISADGRFIAFESEATNLAAPDGNLSQDVFLWDRGA